MKTNIIKASLCFFIKGLLLFNTFCFAQEQRVSSNGEVFTPKGDIRFLVICADFKGFGDNVSHGEWKASDQFPKFLSRERNEVFYSDTLDFVTFSADSTVKNLSKLYFEMSNKKEPFRVIADLYPSKITIDPSSIKGSGWGGVNRAVIDKMKKESPDFDWSPYDQRKNRPNFKFDNSDSGPDDKPDYVVILYRYDNNWSPQPKKGMNRWLNGAEGASSLSVGNIEYNGINVGSDGFFSFSSTTKNASSFIGMFKHELGHELFSGPHYMGANEAYGKRFYAPAVGWGSTVCSYHLNETINAWERWMLGWIDIKYDVVNQNKVKCRVKDFATTGDVIRVEIPNSNGQHLWIENHQQKSVFDHNALAGELINKPKGSSGIPDVEKGLYLFVEDMMSDRTQISTRFVYDMNAVNGVKLINAQGNYDYEKPLDFTHTSDWSVYWNTKLYHFKRGKANAFTGLNPYVAYRHDFNDSGEIHFKHNFNGGKGESTTMAMEIEGDTNMLFYGINGGRNLESINYRRSAAFQHKDKLSMVSNPVIVNYPFYDKKGDSISKVFFNGMDLKFKERKSGEFKVNISFNNFQLKKDLRVAGNVGIVKDVYALKKKSCLLINRSGTVNRRIGINGGFINPTNFSVSDSGGVMISPKSKILIHDDSKVEVHSWSLLRLKRKSVLNVEGDAILVFHKGARFEIHKKCIVNILDGAKVIIEKGVEFNGVVTTESLVYTKSDIVKFRSRIKN